MTLATPPPRRRTLRPRPGGSIGLRRERAGLPARYGLYHVVFSNRGATVKSWTLKKFRDSAGKPLELVNQKGAEKAGYPFSFTFRDKQPTSDLNKALWVAHPGQETISFEYSDGRTHATKTFALQRDGYMVQYSDEVMQAGVGLPHLVQWRGGFGDMAVQNAAGQQATIHYDLEKTSCSAKAPSPQERACQRRRDVFLRRHRRFVLRRRVSAASEYNAADDHFPGHGRIACQPR